MADLVFNHSEHARLIRSANALLADAGRVLLSWCSYRPWLAARDAAFVRRALAQGKAIDAEPEAAS